MYLNILDQFIKRTLHCKHYGRYVDDFYIVSRDKKLLKSIINEIERFMIDSLHLEIQNKKTHILDYKYGIEFLGAYIKPYRLYISNKTIKRINRKLYHFQNYNVVVNVSNMVNSYIGMFSHYKSNKIKKEMMEKTNKLFDYGKFLGYYEKFVEI